MKINQLWLDSNLITYVLSGKKDCISPKKTHRLNAGEALFIRNGIYSTRQYLDDDYCEILFFINDRYIK